jgi:hypothetical protein
MTFNVTKLRTRVTISGVGRTARWTRFQGSKKV